MTSQHKHTTLVLTLLSITLLSTTGCIQKQKRVIYQPSVQSQQSSQQSQQHHQNIGAKTVPYTPQPIQYSQPTVQYTQPPVQQRVQYTQPPVQQRVQYTQPPVQQRVQYTQLPVQYIEEVPTSTYEEEGCTDEVSSDCNRKPVNKEQQTTSYVQQSSGGSMHTLKSVQGQTIKIGERKNGFTFPNHPGKVILLEMFGQNCPHCIKEVPTLKKIKRKYGNQVEVIAIHSQGILSPSGAKRFISRNRVNYPITDGSRATDLQNFIQNTYSWTGVLPFTMIIKDGQTEGSFGGEVSYKELVEVINPLF